MENVQNPNLVTNLNQRIHVIHDRDRNRTLGYVLEADETGRNVHVRVATAACSDKDVFNKKVGIKIVKTRLDSGIKGSNRNRMFDSTIAMSVPSTASEWRELDQTVVQLADLKL